MHSSMQRSIKNRSVANRAHPTHGVHLPTALPQVLAIAPGRVAVGAQTLRPPGSGLRPQLVDLAHLETAEVPGEVRSLTKRLEPGMG